MVKQNCRSKIFGFVYLLVVLAMGFLLTLLDLLHLTLYFTQDLATDHFAFFLINWIPELIIIPIPIVMYLVQPSRLRLVLLSVLVIWIVILPHIRWDHTKSFFIDARRLNVEMTIVEAHKIMEPYYSFKDSDRIFFKPYEGGGDVCIVYLNNSKISKIIIRLD